MAFDYLRKFSRVLAFRQAPKHFCSIARIAPKVLLPGRGFKIGGKDTLRQKWVLPWLEWIKQ
jgi:hypothetical protein